MRTIFNLSEEEIKSIVELSKKKISRTEISKKYNVSINTIRTICKKYDIKIVEPKKSDESLKELFIDLVEKGTPRYKIAKQLNISEKRVTNLAKIFNVNLKSKCSGKKVDIDIELLKYLFNNKDYSLKDMTMILNVSATTIYKKAKSLGLKYNGSTAYITPYEKKILTDLYINQSKSINEISKILNQQEHTIESKLWMLGLTDKLPKKIRRKNMPYENEDFMKDYLNPYISHSSIEKKYGIKASTISNWRRRDFGKNFLQNNTILNYNTSYELKVKEILEELDIAYIQQKQIDKYKVDFYLGQKLCIECDGVYYHKIKLEHDLQREYFFNNNGYYCLHLTDIDFLDSENLKQKIQNILICRLKTKLLEF